MFDVSIGSGSRAICSSSDERLNQFPLGDSRLFQNLEA